MNHLVAGIGTDNVGEAEISAWELGSGGCGRYWAAWMLDLAGMLLGMVWPHRVWRAFVAGRRMRNAYGWDEEMVLNTRVDDVRRSLTRTDGPRSTASTYAAFGGCLVIAVPVTVGFVATVAVSLPVWVLTKERRALLERSS